MKPEDRQLVEACRKKDQRAYKQLYERFAPTMYAICQRYTHNDLAAGDVMHDGFIKVFENLDQLRDGESVKNWMASIMVHTALNALRKEPPVRELADEEQEDAHFIYHDDAFDNYDIELILSAIRELPSRYRAVFNLREIEGHTFEETGQILGITAASARSYLARARQLLITKLKKKRIVLN